MAELVLENEQATTNNRLRAHSMLCFQAHYGILKTMLKRIQLNTLMKYSKPGKGIFINSDAETDLNRLREY